MRILLTDGAGLTARQVATRLDEMGHDVTAMVSDDLCLARFTRHLGPLHHGPPFGSDPLAWFGHMIDVAVGADIAVVFPTQEQVAVLSHQLPRLTGAGLSTAVPPFASLLRVQDKVSARRTLEEVGIAQPRSVVAQSAAEVRSWSAFPAFVKAPLATGSTGVRRVTDRASLSDAVTEYLAAGAGEDGGVLVQVAVDGGLVMAQGVFDAGALVAFHANARLREGANGSASAKLSVDQPSLRSNLERLGRALGWHGSLSVDAVMDGERPLVIDVNPRLVEPGNAWAAGTDLVGALLAVATGAPAPATAPSRPGVRTHQLLMAVLGAAQHTGHRRCVAAELARALRHTGVYAGSHEELLPSRGDRRTLIPMAAAVAATLARPQWSRIFTDGAVSHYALAPAGWRQLRHTAPLTEVSAVRA
ncbi:MAG: ATP-grasp domain-containing protein [Acidimicrobiales bacterium]